MEERRSEWWWAAGSAGQLAWAVTAVRRKSNGNPNLMPVKAFGVATLFVSSFACAAVSLLHAAGIRQVTVATLAAPKFLL